MSQSKSDLRVLVLPQADIQRLRSLLSKEISNKEIMVYDHKILASEYESGAEGKKWHFNRAAVYQDQVNKLSNLQRHLKYSAMYPVNYGIMQNLFYNLAD